MNQLSTSITAQQARLLAALRQNPITTIEAREVLAIMHPAGRIKELRAQGYEIVTLWQTDSDVSKTRHRVGLYCLMQEPAK